MDRYRRMGYVVITGLSRARELARLREIYAEIFPVRRARPHGLVRELNPDGTLSMERLPDPDREFPEIRDTRFYRVGAALSAEALGISERRLNLCAVFIDKPSRGPPTTHHQHVVNRRPAGLVEDVTLWMALDGVHARNGCLTLVPGSHLERTLDHTRLGHIDEEEITLERIVECPLAAGSAVLFGDRMIHGSTANRTRSSRRVVSLYAFYTRASRR